MQQGCRASSLSGRSAPWGCAGRKVDYQRASGRTSVPTFNRPGATCKLHQEIMAPYQGCSTAAGKRQRPAGGDGDGDGDVTTEE
jgi:hypothetical protein